MKKKRPLYLMILVLFQIFHLSSVQAKVGISKCELLSAFQAAYFSSEIYCPGVCGYNSKRLAAFLRDIGVPVHEVKVLFVFNKSRTAFPVPGKRVQNPKETWRYHVSLEYGGTVYDLDFAEPVPVARRRYFYQMLLPKRLREKNLRDKMEFLQQFRIVEIPADRFIEEFASEAGIYDYYSLSNPDYKVSEVSAYLSKGKR